MYDGLMKEVNKNKNAATPENIMDRDFGHMTAVQENKEADGVVAAFAPPLNINLKEANPLEPWFQKHKIKANKQVLEELGKLGVHEPQDFKHLDEEDKNNLCALWTKVDGKKFCAALKEEENLV